MSTRLGGRYQVVREIGAGGMGRVFHAVDTETGRSVAAKVLIAGEEIDLQALLRFQQEGAVLSTLKHPNIVQVYGTHLEEHTSCIIMELLEGRPLGEVMCDERLPLSRIKNLMQQVASALAFAHRRSIVHRDIKPDNIMVVGDDHVKVTDFGIARIIQEGTSLATRTGMAMGTPLYMSPEQIEGHKIDGRTDIYSFGAVLYQLATNRPPFEGQDPLTIAFKHVHKAPAPPGEVSADVPGDWEDLILKCLAKNPDDRIQTAAALEEAVASLSIARTSASVRPRTTERSITDESEAFETLAREQETRTRLEQGKAKELSGELRGALRDYRSALTVAPPGPLRDELQTAIARVTPQAQPDSDTGTEFILSAKSEQVPVADAHQIIPPPAISRVSKGVPAHWLAIGGGAVALLIIAVVVAIAAGSRGSSSAKQTPTPRPVPAKGGRGGVAGGFGNPSAVAVDAQGNLWVADTGNGQIKELSSGLAALVHFGSQGSGAGQFNNPKGVALDAQGNLFIADSGNNRIQELSSNGQPLARWGAEGSGAEQFKDPEGLALDAQGNLYVADTGNDRIQELSSSGKFIRQWGGHGSAAGQFDHPTSVAIDAQGNVWVSDTGNNRLQRFSSAGKGLGWWGTPGSNPGQFNHQQGIALDSQGNVFVADTGNNRVQEFSSTSDPVNQWGSRGSGPKQMNGPTSVAVGPGGAISVADAGNNRILKLSASGNQ